MPAPTLEEKLCFTHKIVEALEAMKPEALTRGELELLSGLSDYEVTLGLQPIRAKVVPGLHVYSRKVDGERRYVLVDDREQVFDGRVRHPRPRGTRSPSPIAIERWELLKGGKTISSIAQDQGLSREGVRQSIITAVGIEVYETEIASQREKRVAATRSAPRPPRPITGQCFVCGRDVRRKMRPRDHAILCGGWCSECYVRLRFHTIPAYRAHQRELIAKEILARPSSNEYQRRHALKVLAGEELNSQGRWLTKKSSAWPYAIEAYRRKLPIWYRLPLEIQRRVQQRVLEEDRAARSKSSEPSERAEPIVRTDELERAAVDESTYPPERDDHDESAASQDRTDWPKRTDEAV